MILNEKEETLDLQKAIRKQDIRNAHQLKSLSKVPDQDDESKED